MDHDHNTGIVRSLLCYTCNKFVLGFVEFDPIAAHNAAIYLAEIAAAYGEEYAPNLSHPLVETNRPARPVMRLPPVKIAPPDDGLPF